MVVKDRKDDKRMEKQAKILIAGQALASETKQRHMNE
jgi:hypothetical protein